MNSASISKPFLGATFFRDLWNTQYLLKRQSISQRRDKIRRKLLIRNLDTEGSSNFRSCRKPTFSAVSANDGLVPEPAFET